MYIYMYANKCPNPKRVIYIFTDLLYMNLSGLDITKSVTLTGPPFLRSTDTFLTPGSAFWGHLAMMSSQFQAALMVPWLAAELRSDINFETNYEQVTSKRL